MNINLLIILFLLILTCSFSRKIDPVKYVEKIESQFISKMKKERNYLPYMLGGKYSEDFYHISLGFYSREMADLAKARSIYITCTEELINLINLSKPLRPYLHNFPADNRNVNVQLVFLDNNDNYFTNELIAFIFTVEKRVIYYGYNETKKLYKIHEETYEEALKAIEDSKMATTKDK